MLDGCALITLPRVAARQGSITAVEGGRTIPFPIARAYYLYDVPGGESRGGHAHRTLSQLLVCVMGACEVTIDDGQARKTVRLDRAYRGLLIKPMIWRELDNFSSGAICLALASETYDERDYIRGYDEFLREAQSKAG